MRQRIYEEPQEESKTVLKADALSLLEEAFDATNESHIIGGLLAEFRKNMGDAQDATRIFNNALTRRPNDSRLRSLQVSILAEHGDPQVALDAALSGVKYDPTSWRLYRGSDRLLRRLNGDVSAIRGHYETAIRHHKGDLLLLLEYAVYLFTSGLYAEAQKIFNQAKDLPIPAVEKRQIRFWWEDDKGKRLIFNGRVAQITGNSAIAQAIPENFKAYFWRTNAAIASLQRHD